MYFYCKHVFQSVLLPAIIVTALLELFFKGFRCTKGAK